MTKAAKSLVSALCKNTPSLKYKRVTMYVDTPSTPRGRILSHPHQIILTADLITNDEYRIEYK